MRFSLVVLIALLFAVAAECKRKRKFDGDFEFAEEVSLPIIKINLIK